MRHVPAWGPEGLDDSLESRDYLDVLRRRWLSVVITVLACLALTTAGTLLMTKQYTATTRLFFGVQGGESVSDLAQGSTFTEKQMSSYAQVATSPLVLDRVIKRLRLSMTAESLAADVTASAPADTVILEILATSTDPRLAAKIANAIGAELTSVAGDLSPARPDGSRAARTIVTGRVSKSRPRTCAGSPPWYRNCSVEAGDGYENSQ
jgi:succinoglycan biosynthesis transport protein ExoP